MIVSDLIKYKELDFLDLIKEYDDLIIFKLKGTNFIFEISCDINRIYFNSYWYENREVSDNGWAIELDRSFEYIFDHCPAHLQEKLVFHLDLFR